jgi:hypothetical protein
MKIRRNVKNILFIYFFLFIEYFTFGQSIPDNQDIRISNYVASVRLSKEYWPQYIIVENNHTKYPIKVEIDIIYSLVFRRDEPEYEKRMTLYSSAIFPMKNMIVELNIRGHYIVKIITYRVVAFTD